MCSFQNIKNFEYLIFVQPLKQFTTKDLIIISQYLISSSNSVLTNSQIKLYNLITTLLKLVFTIYILLFERN